MAHFPLWHRWAGRIASVGFPIKVVRSAVETTAYLKGAPEHSGVLEGFEVTVGSGEKSPQKNQKGHPWRKSV